MLGFPVIFGRRAKPPPEPSDTRYGPGPFAGTLCIDPAGHWMREDAADMFIDAHDRLGGESIALTVNNATRTYEEQVRLFNLYGYPRAAYPGTSNHEWRGGLGGTAFDVNPPYHNGGHPGPRKHEVVTDEGFRRLSYEDWHYSRDGR